MNYSGDLAVFGGTFDPIHTGHLTVAEEVRVKLGITEITFVPAGKPWLKVDRPISSSEHRLAMVQLAVADNPHFRVSTVEIDRPGPTYTADTVDMLSRRMRSEARLLFLMGGDSLQELPEWKDPHRIIQLCRLVVFSRPGSRLASMKELELAVPGVSGNVIIVEVPQIDVSATEIRKRVRRGDPIDGLVPPAVRDYILEHRLYREP